MIFPHRITHTPVVISEDEFAGISKSFGVSANYAAFLQERTESIDIINQTGSSTKIAAIYVQGRCDAKPLDRITHDGTEWEVTGAALQRSQTAIHHTKIMARELPE